MVNSQVAGSACVSRSCAGCGGRIADRFLLFSMERYWHTRCLKCSCCQAQLGEIGSTCYSKGGMILCRTDYIRSDATELQAIHLDYGPRGHDLFSHSDGTLVMHYKSIFNACLITLYMISVRMHRKTLIYSWNTFSVECIKRHENQEI